MIDLLSYIPQKRKNTSSGWVSFNAPCCVHKGESQDKRLRGGIKQAEDDWSYHCFNCGYKASYVIGRRLSAKLRQLMSWLGIADDTIRKLAIEAMRHEESDTKFERKKFIKRGGKFISHVPYPKLYETYKKIIYTLRSELNKN